MSPYIVKELLHYCNVHLKESSKLSASTIKYYDFTFVLKGELTYVVDEKQYVLCENDAILIRPGSMRERLPNNDSAKYVSYHFTVFDPSLLPQKTYLKDVISHDIRQLTSIFSASHISEIYSSREKAINLLNYILWEIKDILDFYTNNKHVIDIIKYINDNITKPISLASISQNVNLSKEYTSHIFKKETGKTVTDYINERKMLIAKKMILETSYPLTDISERLSYENYTYFSRIFKKQFDISPKALRKSIKKK